MGLCQTPGLPCPKEGESLGWGEKEQTWVEIMNPSRGAGGSGGLPRGTAKLQLSDCSAPATRSNQLEVLICLLDALNTNNSKLKHLNAYLQRPAVHTYSRNICLFKQRRKKKIKKSFLKIFLKIQKKKVQSVFYKLSSFEELASSKGPHVYYKCIYLVSRQARWSVLFDKNLSFCITELFMLILIL